MKFVTLSIAVFLFIPSLLLAETGKPAEHKHEKREGQHTHHLPLSGDFHLHNAREMSDEKEEAQPELNYVPITSNEKISFEREVGSYSKYDTEGDMTLLQISFRSTKLETDEAIFGVAEVPMKSCENEIMGRVYIAYDGAEEGKWHSFERVKDEIYLLKLEEHICSISKSAH